MKQFTFLITLLITGLAMLSSSVYPQDKSATETNDKPTSGEIIVRIKGFDSNNGLVRITLNNSGKNYEKGTPYKNAVEKITNRKVEFSFDSVPFGEYAIKCYHDENSNGILDKNMMGMPIELFGFSNDAPANFGPPDYEDARFFFNEETKIIVINLQ